MHVTTKYSPQESGQYIYAIPKKGLQNHYENMCQPHNKTTTTIAKTTTL